MSVFIFKVDAHDVLYSTTFAIPVLLSVLRCAELVCTRCQLLLTPASDALIYGYTVRDQATLQFILNYLSQPTAVAAKAWANAVPLDV